MSADKVRPHHLARKGIVYVRQSSAHQVLRAVVIAEAEFLG